MDSTGEKSYNIFCIGRSGQRVLRLLSDIREEICLDM